MIYKVGECSDYYFIYDTDIDLCRMVRKKRFKKDVSIMMFNTPDIYKVIMMYNFGRVYDIFSSKEFYYNLVMYNSDLSLTYNVKFMAAVTILPLSNFKYSYMSQFINSVSYMYGYLKDYVFILGLKILELRNLDTGIKDVWNSEIVESLALQKHIYDIRSGYTVLTLQEFGIVIPFYMIGTTLRLLSSGDIHEFFEVYDFLLSSNLEVRTCSNKGHKYSLRGGEIVL